MSPAHLDEYPIHQSPHSLRHVPSSDRNFYDRCYFNAHDRTGDIFMVTGGGVYPNLGVIDAFVAVRRGGRQWTLRCSDAMDERPLDLAVGPYRVEVIEPLEVIRIVCDGDDHGLSLDLTWRASFPAIDEHPHLLRAGTRAILDAQRFAQVGTWEGELRVDGDNIGVEPSVWLGTRDRSWGIRPVGEAEPPGRLASEPTDGFWWLYVPMRFDEYAVVLICQEEPDGFRSLNDATRVWPDGRIEQLGWPRVTIDYRPGTRHPLAATIALTDADGEPLTMRCETLGYVGLNVGAGYGGDPDWAHGQWRGRNWVDGAVYDMTDPEVVARVPFSVVDHVGRAVMEGATAGPRGRAEGWGLFEHGTFGRHDPSGFADWGSVAP